MEIISFLHAVSVLNSPWEEIRPMAGEPFAIISNAIKDRYNFQNAGASLAGQQANLTLPSFATGHFDVNGAATIINQIEFRPTGVVFACAKTEHIMLLAEDLFEFLSTTFGFRKPPASRTFTNLTTMISKYPFAMDKMFDRWLEVQAFINALMERDEAPLVPLGVRMIGFKNDAFVAERQFLFERRIPSPPGENWIYSQAPVSSEKHVKILEKIEAIFKD